jgi:hypothetical protein
VLKRIELLTLQLCREFTRQMLERLANEQAQEVEKKTAPGDAAAAAARAPTRGGGSGRC